MIQKLKVDEVNTFFILSFFIPSLHQCGVSTVQHTIVYIGQKGIWIAALVEWLVNVDYQEDVKYMIGYECNQLVSLVGNILLTFNNYWVHSKTF